MVASMFSPSMMVLPSRPKSLKEIALKYHGMSADTQTINSLVQEAKAFLIDYCLSNDTPMSIPHHHLDVSAIYSTRERTMHILLTPTDSLGYDFLIDHFDRIADGIEIEEVGT